ncbi:MAG: ABC transporter permease [Clostridia bacterium]|nr:ABC transporter permease [Clostridia bacterium]
MTWLKKHSAQVAAYSGLALCIVFFTILTPIFGESIWSAAKIKTLMQNVIVLALMSVGATFVYSLGSMDISIGRQVGLYATLTVIIGNATGSLLWGILLSLVISVVISAINGAAGEVLNIHPVISSLVFQMVISGVSSVMYNSLGSRNVALMNSIDVSIFRQTWFMILALVIEVLIVGYLFNFTKLGKNAKAIGANPTAARQSGINLVQYKVYAYIIMGVCVVLAALFQMGYTASASDSTGTGFEMNVMVALILGGMPLSGGMKSKVSCAIVGSFTYALLSVGLPMLGVAANQVFVIKAVLFLIVVVLTCRKKTGVLPR